MAAKTKEYGVYIGGEWVDSAGKGTFETTNPANGRVLATFPNGTRKDVERAVAAAEKAYPRWRGYPAPRRAEIVLSAALLMEERKEELGALVTREMGKVIAEGRGDVQESIDFLKYISGEGRRLLGETTPSELPDKICFTLRQPKGVVGCITPWNFPTAIPSWKIGTALVCGNTIVFKPASYTPLCGAALMDIYEEAGLPPGVLNMVTGEGGVVGTAIVEHPKIRSISFTGSVPVGKEVYVKGAKRMVHVHLELGGKNPIIAMEDADLDLLLDGILFGAFGTAGQRCTAASRLIIHEDIYDRFMDLFLARVARLRIGDPMDPKVDVGPVVSKAQMERVLNYIDIGKKEGAKLLCGGHRMTKGAYARGFFIEPTVFLARHGMRIAVEEIFGPVLSVIKIKSFEEAVAVANDVEYGLSSSIYTRDINRAWRAIDRLEAGITYINAPTIGAEVHLPFGGIKNTGVGGREAGSTAIDEFTEIKTVFVDYSGRLQKAQIEEVNPPE